mgnify:CR=1 FL=1
MNSSVLVPPRWLGALGLVLALAGCALALFRAGPQQVTVAAQPSANRDTETAVDLVFSYTPEAAAQLPDSALLWFTRKLQLQERFPGSLKVVSLSVAPGQRVSAAVPESEDRKPVRVLAYAWMMTPGGQTPLDLTALRRPVISIGVEQLEVAPAP